MRVASLLFVDCFLTSILTFGSVAQAHTMTCDGIATKLSYASLKHAATVSVEQGHVEHPFWFKRMLPAGVKFVATPGREHAPDRIQKELGPDFIALQVDFEYNGHNFTATVGVSPDALADNLARAQRGEPLSFLPENARAGALWVHGGGTESSSHANAANAHQQFSKRGVYVVGIDWWGHGTNRPEHYSLRPMDYVEAAPFFMKKFFGDKVPVFQTGHSMGGQVADLIHSLMSPEDMDAKFPGLPFKGVVMFSAPTDPSAGASLHAKVTRDREYTDRDGQWALFWKDNMNLASQEPLTDQFFLQTWNDEMLARRKFPAFAGMGDLDDVCYLGCEGVYGKYLEARKEVTSHMYSDVVDHSGKKIKADHMIPKYYEPGQTSRFGLGASMPIAFAHALEWIERHVLGNTEFTIFNKRDLKEVEAQIREARKIKDPEKRAEALAKITPIDPIKESTSLQSGSQYSEDEQVHALLLSRGILEPLKKDPDYDTLNKQYEIAKEAALKETREINVQKAYRGTISKVIGLFAKNTLFREFVKRFEFKKRVSTSKELAQDLNNLLVSIEKFQSEATNYDKSLSNPNIVVAAAKEWRAFFDWMRWQRPEDRAAAESTAQAWATSENLGHRFAAGLMAQTFGDSWQGPRLQSLPAGFRVTVETLTNAASFDSKSWQAVHRWIATGDESLRSNVDIIAKSWLKAAVSEETPKNTKDPKQKGEKKIVINDTDKWLGAYILAKTSQDPELQAFANEPVPQKIQKSHPLFRDNKAPEAKAAKGAAGKEAKEVRVPTAKEFSDYYLHKGGISELLSKIDRQKQAVLGYRDVNLEALTYAYPELKHMRNEQTRMNDEKAELIAVRDLELMPTLVTLHAQRMQMQKLFNKDAFDELMAKGAELESMLGTIDTNRLASTKDGQAVIDLYWTLEQAGWKNQAFESFMGPDLRNFFSTLHDYASDIKALDPTKNADKIAKKLGDAAAHWEHNHKQFIELIDSLKGSGDLSTKLLAHRISPTELRSPLQYPDDAFAIFRVIRKQGWTSPHMAHLVGPELSAFFAHQSKLAKNIETAHPKEKQKAMLEFAAEWPKGAAEFANLIEKLQAQHPDYARHAVIEKLAKAEKISHEALDVLGEFFQLREQFILENHHLWTAESRPTYPARYYELIKIYKAKQAEYQHARQEAEIAQRKVATNDELGPYMKYIFAKFDALENRITQLNGNENDIGHRRSLTSVEARLEEINQRAQAIDEEVVNKYLFMMYRFETINVWKALNDESTEPQMDMMNQLLDRWNSLWRDPTGGQVQDTAGY